MTGADDLRVGDAERTRVTEALHDHFAQGRLTRDELEERLDATLAAKTVGDLRRVTRDLPGPQTAGGPGRTITRPRRRRPRPLLFALGVIAFLVIATLISGPGGALLGVLKLVVLIWLVTALLGFMSVRGRCGAHGPRGHWR